MGIGWVRECGTEKLVIMFPWSSVLGGGCGFRSGQHVGSKWSLEVIKITQGSMLSEMRRPRAEPYAMSTSNVVRRKHLAKQQLKS